MVYSVRALADDAQAIIRRPQGRHVVGITGPPGAGKSTLAEALARVCKYELGNQVAIGLPMDGFHLPNWRLRELGRLDRKGAPDTFDAESFVSALRRLSDPGVSTMKWPAYSRLTHEPIPDAITIPAEAQLVFVEGNYLLLREFPWNQVRTIIDTTWYVTADEQTLEARLMRRQLIAGLAPTAATRHVTLSDMLNVARVEQTAQLADRIVKVSSRDPLLASLTDPATGEAIEYDNG